MVEYNNQKVKLPMLVVKGQGPNLMGRDWLANIHLNWHALHQVEFTDRLSTLIDKFAPVFLW